MKNIIGFYPEQFFDPNAGEWTKINPEKDNFLDNEWGKHVERIIPNDDIIIVIWYETDSFDYNIISLYKGRLEVKS